MGDQGMYDDENSDEDEGDGEPTLYDLLYCSRTPQMWSSSKHTSSRRCIGIQTKMMTQKPKSGSSRSIKRG